MDDSKRTIAEMEISKSQLQKCFVIIVVFILVRVLGAKLWEYYFKTGYEVSLRFILFLFSIFLLISVGLVYFGFTKWVKVDIKPWWKTKTGIWGDIGLGILGTVSIVIIILVIAILFYALGFKPPQYPMSQSFDFSPMKILLFLFFGFAIAAFQEETIFRGCLQIAFTERYGKWIGNLLQAALFSLCHIGYYPWKAWPVFIIAFITGLMLGWLKMKRGTLLVPAIAHGLIG